MTFKFLINWEFILVLVSDTDFFFQRTNQMSENYSRIDCPYGLEISQMKLLIYLDFGFSSGWQAFFFSHRCFYFLSSTYF